MSTRATYQFIGHSFKGATTYYIHHDNYPGGAIRYLLNALKCDNGRGGLRTMFLRANDNAELTESHAIHGDTDYRYTIDCQPKGIILVTVAKHGYKDNTFSNIFKGELHEFVNSFGAEYNRELQAYYTKNNKDLKEEDKLPQLHKIKLGKYSEYFVYLTVQMLEDMVKKKGLELVDYAVKAPSHTGNLGSHQSDFTYLHEQLALLKPFK